MEYKGYNTATRGGCTKKCCCITVCIGLCIVFAVVLTLVLVYLFHRPGLPHFEVESFSLKNFTAVSNDSSKVSFAADVAMTSRNPNMYVDVWFTDAQSVVYYKKKPLGSNDVPPFSLGTKGKTSLNTSFAADVNDVDVGGIDNANVVSFELWFFTKFGFKGRKGNFNMKAFCGDLAVGLPSDGTGRFNRGAEAVPVWAFKQGS